MQNACSQPVGSCLGSQIKDLAEADDARIKLGTTPLYYVSRWGGGRASARQVCVRASRSECVCDGVQGGEVRSYREEPGEGAM